MCPKWNGEGISPFHWGLELQVICLIWIIQIRRAMRKYTHYNQWLAIVGIWNAQDVSKFAIHFFSGLVCLEHSMCLEAHCYISVMFLSIYIIFYCCRYTDTYQIILFLNYEYVVLFVSAVPKDKNQRLLGFCRGCDRHMTGWWYCLGTSDLAEIGWKKSRGAKRPRLGLQKFRVFNMRCVLFEDESL